MSNPRKIEWQRRKQAAFTPDQRAEYNAKMRDYARKARAMMSAEEIAASRQRDNEYRARLKKGRSKERLAAIRESKRIWIANKRATDPEKMRAERAKWMRQHRQTPQGAIELRLRDRLRKAVSRTGKRERKASSTMELAGCSREFLKGWLESKFRDGMSWERMNEIHIDHIRPVASFDLTDPEQQRACFHYTNLQPLWANENLAKSDKVVPFAAAA